MPARKYFIGDAQKLAEFHGGKCLSTDIGRFRTKLIWQCKDGHIWESVFENFITNPNYWCPYCDKIQKLKNAQKIAEDRGGKCLSEEYNWKRMEWQCELGHTWKTSIDAIKRGSWCSRCNTVLEEFCRNIFETLFETKFPKYRADWLKSPKGFPMELDGFSEAINLAFEHHGAQHYKQIKMFKNNMLKIQEYDKHKEMLCKEKGIPIIVVPHLFLMTKLKDLINIIEKQLPENLVIKNKNINFDELIKNSTKFIKNNKRLNYIREEALKRNWVCVSNSFISSNIPLSFICDAGHEISILIGGFMKKQGCGSCYYATIEKIKEVAKNKGYICLSNEYIPDDKLKFSCANGHIFFADWSHYQRKTICISCIKEDLSTLEHPTLEKIKVFSELRGEKCLSEIFAHHKQLKFLCKNNHIFFKRWFYYKQKEDNCQKCKQKFWPIEKQKKFNIQEVREKSLSKQFQLLYEENALYLKEYYNFKCLKCGAISEKQLQNIMFSPSGCRDCGHKTH